MKKYEVIRVDYEDKRIGLKVGDIVEFKKYDKDIHIVRIKLPKHLYGKGTTAFLRYKNRNYWLLSLDQLKEVK